MPAYEVEIEHREGDQVFSYHHGGGLLHFNASLLARLRGQMPDEFRRITMDLTSTEYDLCMNHRGIEEARVAALTPDMLCDAGYSVILPTGAYTIIDGHHRLVRRYRCGLREMDFWITYPEVWQHCLVHYTAEGEQEIAASIPPKVENPAQVATAVVLHKRDPK